ncbi:hypothetical protein BDQ12DRAFT_693603 [Crucibulum laeve]|uniref:Uncharacterized protein n=1 Tax=Crucibulum laeve TaxID=68775 RepID=A0A5C3LG25_9AGAR|nr:hypothetical protein BDQ12DRAFT_693603 [Crucibulum laeve]
MRKELLGRKLAVFNITSTHPRFQLYRSLLHAELIPRVMQGYHAFFEKQAEKLLRSLSERLSRLLGI